MPGHAGAPERGASRKGDASKGRLVVLAGPSGVGKSSIVAELRKLYPQLWFSVSATTREQRPGEVDGRDYRFVSPAEFDRMIAEGELLEWADIHSGTHRSGTPRQPIEERLNSGEPALLELDLQGARSVRAAMPDALLVFINPPSWDELVARLTGRGTESEEVVARRLATAREELAARPEFDTEIVNADVHSAARELLDLLTGA
ncbi:guanylate kinase [Sciscionella sediminilitoris]|uniref:guanylate kinase n=1 Tax=Sciscionella sediminilitoris TaxID=1445613 RepID=UPI00068DB838|nr:guanylate kinase [Sciscionella sp. SE31]